MTELVFLIYTHSSHTYSYVYVQILEVKKQTKTYCKIRQPNFTAKKVITCGLKAKKHDIEKTWYCMKIYGPIILKDCNICRSPSI